MSHWKSPIRRLCRHAFTRTRGSLRSSSSQRRSRLKPATQIALGNIKVSAALRCRRCDWPPKGGAPNSKADIQKLMKSPDSQFILSNEVRDSDVVEFPRVIRRDGPGDTSGKPRVVPWLGHKIARAVAA